MPSPLGRRIMDELILNKGCACCKEAQHKCLGHSRLRERTIIDNPFYQDELKKPKAAKPAPKPAPKPVPKPVPKPAPKPSPTAVALKVATPKAEAPAAAPKPKPKPLAKPIANSVPTETGKFLPP